jgi:hypothetical protein
MNVQLNFSIGRPALNLKLFKDQALPSYGTLQAPGGKKLHAGFSTCYWRAAKAGLWWPSPSLGFVCHGCSRWLDCVKICRRRRTAASRKLLVGRVAFTGIRRLRFRVSHPAEAWKRGNITSDFWATFTESFPVFVVLGLSQ